jgi:hypothetical protein
MYMDYTKMKKHKVRTHHWVKGLLKTVEQEFETLEEAIEFSNTLVAHVVKVINNFEEVIISRVLEVIPDQINVRDDDGYSYP